MIASKLTRATSMATRDRSVVIVALAAVIALSWMYTIYLAGGLEPASAADLAMPQAQYWSPPEFLFMFLMWVIMMVAMMLPSASPMILTYANAQRGKSRSSEVLPGTTWLTLGYVAAWSVFSLIATLAQCALHAAALLSSAMASANSVLGGVILIAAGIFQWTPLKHACLAKCRSPMGFFMIEWRDGSRGAFVMGWRHGVYCVGCCWALMGLLFVTGVMNLLWIALISVFVLVEKIAPHPLRIAQVSGALLIAYGVILSVR